MIVDYNLKKYTIDAKKSIRSVISQFSDAKEKIVFVLSGKRFLGVITNGDILRWLVAFEEVDLLTPCEKITNKDYIFIKSGDDLNSKRHLLEKTPYVPILNDDGSIYGVLKRDSFNEEISIGTYQISRTSPAFIIGEIGNNHNGDLELAKELIDACKRSGACCAKFQMRNLESLYAQTDSSENLGTEYTLDLLKRFQLSETELFAAFDYCQEIGIMPLCTPWDSKSLESLEAYGMLAYKVASADLTNHDLLLKLIATKKPLIISTGMSSLDEIKQSKMLLDAHGACYVFLQCNSTYPTPYKDVHLNFMKTLINLSNNGLAGYSGHERGFEVPIAAVALGAKVIEKHITVDKEMEGNDHKVSLLPHEFAEMVTAIRNVEDAMGQGESRSMSQGELINRVNLAKSLVINQDLPAGSVIENHMIDVRSPGKGIQPNYKNDLIGRVAKRDFKAGDFFYPNDIEDEVNLPKDYQFPFTWGIPVRYHDYDKLMKIAPLPLAEFHLSYRDMDLNLSDFFSEEQSIEFVVHAPELFKGDHTLDLCSEDPSYRQRSIEELQKVVEVTRSLKSYFPKTVKPCIVVNVGGFTDHAALLKADVQMYYERLADSLSQIDQSGVKLIPQTMPPYPWHFGGQKFHNLFVCPREIKNFCERYGYQICYDVSHSKLACNLMGWSFEEFTDLVAPFVAHLHIADAGGVDGEGLQILDGEIDFKSLFTKLGQTGKEYTFIPEIWQGHENQGEGFWIALNRLEQLLNS